MNKKIVRDLVAHFLDTLARHPRASEGLIEHVFVRNILDCVLVNLGAVKEERGKVTSECLHDSVDKLRSTDYWYVIVESTVPKLRIINARCSVCGAVQISGVGDHGPDWYSWDVVCAMQSDILVASTSVWMRLSADHE